MSVSSVTSPSLVRIRAHLLIISASVVLRDARCLSDGRLPNADNLAGTVDAALRSHLTLFRIRNNVLC